MTTDDPLEERADALVSMAHIVAVDAYLTMLRQFPALRSVSEEHWDFTVTIAGVFIGATRLRNVQIGNDREERLIDRVSVQLEMQYPTHGHAGFEHCKAFFERTYDGLARLGHDPRLLAADTIGFWMGWELLERVPEGEEELRLARTLGVLVTHGFFDWWQI